MIENNTCVYRHRRLDTNKIFYIGIGNKKRPYISKGRNKYWKNITNKINYTIEIIAENLSWENACELEELLIFEYGRKDLNLGDLVNMTDGGEGAIGYKHLEETKLSISKKLKNREISLETRRKLSLTSKGNTNCLGRINSEETNKRISSGKLGKKKRGRSVIDLNTEIIYTSITEVSEKFNIKHRTLCGYLDGSRTNKTSFKYFKNKKSK